MLEGFPLYWSRKPPFQSARQLTQLNSMERGVCEFLENLQVIFNTFTILKRKYRPKMLKSYIDIFPSLILPHNFKCTYFLCVSVTIFLFFVEKMLSSFSKIELTD